MFKKQRNKGLIINLKFYRGKLATVTQENGCFFSWNILTEQHSVERIHYTKISVTRGFPIISDIEYSDHISVIFIDVLIVMCACSGLILMLKAISCTRSG